MSNNFDFDFDINDFDFSEINDNNNNIDYVRPPDKPIREILNGSNGYNNYSNHFENNTFEDSTIFDKELEQCLRESELSFLNEEKKQHEYEEERKRCDLIVKERKLICESIRRKLEKVKGHDNANKVTYETILSIIEMWELCQLEYFETEKYSYETIFNIITSIRMTKDEHKFLDALIQIKK